MKRVLIVAQSLKIGGIERSLVDTINLLPVENYEVDLLLFHYGGTYENEIKRKVNKLNSNIVLDSFGRTNQESRANIFSFIIRTVGLVLSKLMGNKALYSLVFCFVKKKEKYDIAISFFNDIKPYGLYYGCNLFVLNRTEAKRKIAWIHADYEKAHLNYPWNNSLYEQFDTVVNVSVSMKRKFDSFNIINHCKSIVVYNPIDIDAIRKKGVERVSRYGKITIVTVGRLEEDKGTKSLFEIALKMHNEGVEFQWLFIGSGVLYNWCEHFIDSHALRGVIILMGHQDNPYPYIKNAYIFVSGSRFETFGLSIAEALILNTPVVALKYDAIGELINGENGIVVNDYNTMKNKICMLIDDNNAYCSIKRNTNLIMDYNSIHNRQITALLDK